MGNPTGAGSGDLILLIWQTGLDIEDRQTGLDIEDRRTGLDIEFFLAKFLFEKKKSQILSFFQKKLFFPPKHNFFPKNGGTTLELHLSLAFCARNFIENWKCSVIQKWQKWPKVVRKWPKVVRPQKWLKVKVTQSGPKVTESGSNKKYIEKITNKNKVILKKSKLSRKII